MDVGALHQGIMETLPELVKWLPWAHDGHRRPDTRRYLRGARAALARRGAFEFIIENVHTGDLLGITSLHRIDWIRRSAGVGYWIRQSSWGKGIATEAVGAVVECAFQVYHLHRLEAHVALENHASQRVVIKVGFEREGIAREMEFVNGRYLDHIQYGLLRPKPLTRNGELA